MKLATAVGAFTYLIRYRLVQGVVIGAAVNWEFLR